MEDQRQKREAELKQLVMMREEREQRQSVGRLSTKDVGWWWWWWCDQNV